MAAVATQSAAANAVSLPVLLNICLAGSLGEARDRAGQLGWRALPETHFESWRRAFIEHQGGSVEVVGWRGPKADSEPDDHAASLAFWVARGRNPHQACAYTTRQGEGLREALAARFGEPPTAFSSEAVGSAYWTAEGVRIAWSRVGAGPRALVYVNISPAP
jgi:hypothetical protein